MTNGLNVNLIGVILDISASEMIKLRAGREKPRRYVKIIDDSHSSIELAIWGDLCKKVDEYGQGDVLALKGGRISEYGGKTINVADDHSNIILNPDLERANQLN